MWSGNHCDAIYLDAAATTYPRREVVECALSFPWENPSSVYLPGVEVRKKVERIRKEILVFLGAGERDLLFTSGGTEANNTAVFSAMSASEKKKKAFCSGIDHASVEEALKTYAGEIVTIPIDRYGRLLPEKADFRGAGLISVTHVNNEIGTIADVEAVYRMMTDLPPEERPLLHIDGVQALGKIPLADIRKAVKMSDFYTISAHKIHGLKGMGALIANKKRIKPFHIGGAQEFGLRGGTENTPGIAAFGKAVELLKRNWTEEFLSSARTMKQTMVRLLHEKLGEGSYVLNSPESSTPFILSVSIRGVKSEILIHSLAEKGIYVSGASACSSTKDTLSRVIRRIGTEEAYADGTIRISLAPEIFYTDPERKIGEQELRFFVEELANIVTEIRKYNR
ncbi:MAG: aminotransferase class V-fold PLP-dependent enzyme [Bacillota bacterium]|nr:aminotransferase class V-fold PLP-dependent enzyme [Bacillota bacterium]